jgi:hypothetical protein
MRVGQRALKRMALAGERLVKFLRCRFERFDAAGIERAKRRHTAHDLQRRAFLRPRFGEQKRAVVELQRREHDLRADARLLSGRAPAQTPGDHQVKNQKQRLAVARGVELDNDPLPHAAHGVRDPAVQRVERRIDGAQHERADQVYAVERVSRDPVYQRFDIQHNIGEFRHGFSLKWNVVRPNFVQTGVLMAFLLLSPAADRARAQEADDNAALPVSLERIRKGLARKPVLTLPPLEKPPDFRSEVEVWGRDLFRPEDLKPGPIPAGGSYQAEMQRLYWNPVDNPLRQPYAAFNQGQLLFLAAQSTINTLIARQVNKGIVRLSNWYQEEKAREEVARAMAEFCAAQPNGGAGVVGCPAEAQK